MTQGWTLLEPLERWDPARPIVVEPVETACDGLADLNSNLRERICGWLKDQGFGKWVDGLRGAYEASDERLFNAYFANRAFSPQVPATPADALDGCRAALLFHLAEHLQRTLVKHLRGLPNAEVMNSKASANPDEFRRIYRFTNLQALVSAIKSVQFDVEAFALCCEDLLVGTDGSRGSFRSSVWPYDFEVMDEQILLGFMRSPSPNLLNQNFVSSPIVAAGLVRSYLEAVLFVADFKSSLSDRPQLTFEKWNQAVKHHRDEGRLSEAEGTWVTEAYGLLSTCLHSGVALSRGEVWALSRLVDRVQKRISGEQAQNTVAREDDCSFP